MPVAGKIFLYRESLLLDELKRRLEGYKVVEHYVEEDLEVDLITDISDLHLEEDLRGIYSYDGVIHSIHRGSLHITPFTTDAPFLFTENEDTTFLIVLAKKQVANNVANKLSMILHDELGAITEPMINPSAVQGFYEGSDGTKILLFDDITVPNMNKITLYGDNVVQTNLYGEYIHEGNPWYAVAKTKKRGYTVGLVRDGAVVVFNSIDVHSFTDYIKEEILPLILKRRQK